MPDDRMIHRRLGHSEKVSQLTDFEFRVWVQYLLSADDFGVMRHGGANLQADNDALGAKTTKQVRRAVEELIKAGLLSAFDHQGRAYCYQPDWQDWQKVDYPRTTLHPQPPSDQLSAKTRELFAKHPGGWGRKDRGTFDKRSANIRETFDGRSEEITLKPVAVSREPIAISRQPSDLDSQAERVQAFMDYYREKHMEVFGVAYMGSQKDYMKSVELCEAFTDSQLRDATLVWYGMDDDFAMSGTRTVPKFASRITACLQLMKAHGIAS
jgi:hypothetical protein